MHRRLVNARHGFPALNSLSRGSIVGKYTIHYTFVCMHLDMCILGLEAEATSGGAKSYRLVGSRIRKPCPLGSMPPNMISRFLQVTIV